MIFFPRLYDPQSRHKAPSISQDNLRILYNECIRGAIEQVAPDQLSHWPINYNMALTQYRDIAGHIHTGTLELASPLHSAFVQHLGVQLNQYEQFKDFFFCHEWRGMKGGTIHDPSSSDACDSAFTFTIKDLDVAQLDLNQWWIDTAIEISTPNRVLQWKADSHAVLVAYCIPTITAEESLELLASEEYYKDIASHIYSLAGFRASVHTQGADAGVCYINIYTTDKSSTYQLHAGAFRRHRASELLPDSIATLIKDVETLKTLYYNLAGLDGDTVQPGAIRAEARIKLANCADFMRYFPPDPLFNTFISLPAFEWW